VAIATAQDPHEEILTGKKFMKQSNIETSSGTMGSPLDKVIAKRELEPLSEEAAEFQKVLEISIASEADIRRWIFRMVDQLLGPDPDKANQEIRNISRLIDVFLKNSKNPKKSVVKLYENIRTKLEQEQNRSVQ